MKRVVPSKVTMLWLIAISLGVTGLTAQTATPPPGQAIAVYRQLLNPVFDTTEVHRLRQVAVDREDLHIVFTDGIIGLLKAVDGHVTGAFFEGEGQILVFPPDRAERTSLALFTGSGILDQRFTVAYLRFFDDALVEELRAGFRPVEDTKEFIAKWGPAETLLARGDSLQLLQAMTGSQDAASTYIHVRLAGTTLGVFDVVFDSHAHEQISLAQAATANGTVFYDSWASFPMRSARQASGVPPDPSDFPISDYKLKTKLSPPTDLSAEAEVTLVPQISGQRTVIFELSRYLKLAEVRVNDQPAEFIQNEAIDGSDLARRGNDLTAVVLKSPTQKNSSIKITFRYSGPVMLDTGNGVILVGSRGTWYPNSGPWFANYDLSFEYPAGWTLLATGKKVSSSSAEGLQQSRFVTEKPITYAGFNLGKFEVATATAAGVNIHAYGAKSVEGSLTTQEAKAGLHPNPAKQVQQIAEHTATTVRFLSRELDPFPYSHLEVTQLPALLSQSWPGLIYLSSMAYLDAKERRALGIRDPFVELLLGRLMLTHETAHQWWGDAVNGGSYRDEWIIEALANYSAMLLLEREDPENMRTALDHYRTELLSETPHGLLADAGPVTLGHRLISSKFPGAFEPVLYGRGTWLVHMLRTMLRQAGDGKSDALFFAALKGLLAGSTNHKISTRDLQRAFEQVMPASLQYENHKSLDWFFDSWVNGAAIPAFRLEKVRFVPIGGNVKVTGVLREDFAAKNMVTAIPIYAVKQNGDSGFLAFVFVDEDGTEFQLTAPAGTKDLLLDPQGTVLRR